MASRSFHLGILNCLSDDLTSSGKDGCRAGKDSLEMAAAPKRGACGFLLEVAGTSPITPSRAGEGDFGQESCPPFYMSHT